MPNVKEVGLTFVLLILGLTVVVPVFGHTETQVDYSIDVSGYTWDHYILTVSIFPQENESWWEPAYLYSAIHGVEQWNDAIQDFATSYPEFSYISQLRFVPIITHEEVHDLDIYISWVAKCDDRDGVIGITENVIELPCTSINSTVCLAVEGPDGHVMTETDMQNIVVHEMGHTLALYHSNQYEDIMYPLVEYGEAVKSISSLDVYAVSQNFKWLADSTQFNSSNACRQQGSLTLPSSIPFVHFSIADENLPDNAQNLNGNFVELFLRPEILATIVAAVVLVVVVVAIVKKHKKPQDPEIVA